MCKAFAIGANRSVVIGARREIAPVRDGNFLLRHRFEVEHVQRFFGGGDQCRLRRLLRELLRQSERSLGASRRLASELLERARFESSGGGKWTGGNKGQELTAGRVEVVHAEKWRAEVRIVNRIAVIARRSDINEMKKSFAGGPALGLCAAGLLLAVPTFGQRAPSAPIAAPTYEAYAIQYGTLPAFRVSGLIAGADTSRRLDVALMIWLLKGSDGRTVLVDAGFQRADLIERWKPTNYALPSVAVVRAGIKPEDVTDIIVSHIHWDHFDGVELFPNARVWLQREEFAHHVDSTGRVLDRAIDAPDAAMLVRLYKAGRVQLVDGDAKEIMPGITVYTGGKHTYQSQYAGVRTVNGTVVIASDNAYLYENLDQRRPIAQTVDSLSNLRAQRRMFDIAGAPRLVVPGHDPAVMTRFERMGTGVVRIR